MYRQVCLPHAGAAPFQPAGVGFTFCSSALWISPCSLGFPSGTASTDRHLLSACGPGSREDAWNMLGAGLFFSYDLHKQEMICLLVSLFALFVSLFILFSPSGRIHFQIVMNSLEDGEQHSSFPLSLTIDCSVLFSGYSDLSFPKCFISPDCSHIRTFLTEPPGRLQLPYLTLAGCAWRR